MAQQGVVVAMNVAVHVPAQPVAPEAGGLARHELLLHCPLGQLVVLEQRSEFKGQRSELELRSKAQGRAAFSDSVSRQ